TSTPRPRRSPRSPDGASSSSSAERTRGEISPRSSRCCASARERSSPSARPPRRSNGRSRGRRRSIARAGWRRPCGRPRVLRGPWAASCSWLRAAPPSISTGITRSAASISARSSARSNGSHMPRKMTPDRTLFFVFVVLTFFGVVMVGSASSYYSLNRTQMTVPYEYLLRQIVYAAAGLFLMSRLMRMDYRRLADPKVVFGLVGGTVLMLLCVFLFAAHKGTHRWISLGVATFQPSELAKLALAVFLAYMAERKGREIASPAIGA